MASPESEISAYQAALEELQEGDFAPSKLFRSLIARDRVSRALGEGDGGSDRPELLELLAELDRRLEATASKIEAAVGRDRLEGWRRSIGPPEGAWWWSLGPRSHPAWDVLTGCLMFLSVALIVSITWRLVAAGADLLGAFGVVAVFAGAGTLAGHGRRMLDQALAIAGVPGGRRHIWRAGLAALLVVASAAARDNLWVAARYVYNNPGRDLLKEGKVSGAIENFRIAISLCPDYGQAHYNLGSAYEEIGEYQEARREYWRAVESDDRSYYAYNNLARLSIARDEDHAGALELLEKALAHARQAFGDDPPEKPAREALATIHKNLGRTGLDLHLLGYAEDHLKAAIELRPDGPAAHYLLARLYDEMGDEAAARREFEEYLRLEAKYPREAEVGWNEHAEERVMGEGPR